MNNLKPKKNLLIILLIIALAVIACFVFIKNYNVQNHMYGDTDTVIEIENNENETGESMNLVVYLQDKNAAISSDCGVIYAKNIQVAKTTGVADASLKYLFQNELSQYGNYESVVIKDGVAQVTISNDNDPSGLKNSSLSSCESRHLFAVLNATLIQYQSIKSVELYSPSGKIEF